MYHMYIVFCLYDRLCSDLPHRDYARLLWTSEMGKMRRIPRICSVVIGKEWMRETHTCHHAIVLSRSGRDLPRRGSSGLADGLCSGYHCIKNPHLQVPILCRCLTAWKNMDMHCFGDDSNIHTHPVLNGVHGSLRKLHSEAICAAHLLILPLDFTASIERSSSSPAICWAEMQ